VIVGLKHLKQELLVHLLEIGRQIGHERARLKLREKGRVEAQIPEVRIGQLLNLHTKGRRSPTCLEPESTSQRDDRALRTMRNVIDTSKVRRKVEYGHIS